MAKRKISLRAIAEATGVHQSTVSRVLKNDPRISKTTAAKVHRAAKRLGYVPDPEYGRLMSHMRSMRDQRFESAVALITDPKQRPSHYSRELQEGAEERCKELGFIATEFPTDFDAKSIRQLNRVLRARNIEGALLLSRHPEDRTPPALDIQHFSVVSTTTFSQPFPVHEVIADHHYNTSLIYDRLHHMGKTRPGHISWQDLNHRQRYAGPMVHYHHYHDILQTTPLPPYVWSGTPHEIESGFHAWFYEHKPDSLILPSIEILRATEDIIGKRALNQVACFAFAQPADGLPGVNQRPRVIGRSAVDLLTSHMQRYEKGWPDVTKHVLIPGELVLV